MKVRLEKFALFCFKDGVMMMMMMMMMMKALEEEHAMEMSGKSSM